MATIRRKSISGTGHILYRERGKQKHRSLGTKSLHKAQSLKREVELLLEETGKAELVPSDKPAVKRRNPTVEEFWREFLLWANANRSPSTVEEYKNWFVQFCEFTDIQRLGDATRENAEQFKTELTRQGKSKPEGVGLDKVSVNNGLKTLRSIWNHAKKLELYSGDNPFAQVEAFKLPRNTDRDYLTGDHRLAGNTGSRPKQYAGQECASRSS